MAEDVNETVARVTAQVLAEMGEHEERLFGVKDLRAHLAELGRGANSAWTISYTTSSAPAIEQLPGRIGGGAAWSISYSTSSSPAIATDESSRER